MGRTGACRYWDRDIITQLPLIPLLDGTFGSEATRCSCHGDVETTTADGIWRRDGALGEPPTAGVHIRRSYHPTALVARHHPMTGFALQTDGIVYVYV
ncbi:hypothetical protein OPV22_012654 [Ensete ventricosum]|uniref:Uncharacterized protein n=1 Tax=Ensete ventricosum TaxID=4639 RepID=A0AAV8R5L0_ENSVE|nr:hypothetical protein OPV22_012654 [Ensete ventricosum]